MQQLDEGVSQKNVLRAPFQGRGFSSPNAQHPHKHCIPSTYSLAQKTCGVHSKLLRYFQHTCGHSTTRKTPRIQVKRLHTHSCITTHHWLQRLGVARVLLLLRGSRRGGVVGRLGLGGGRAAVGHGQLTQVGGV